MPLGRLQAVKLGETFVYKYGIDVSNESVAVSEARRTQETATVASFRKLHVYSALNEEKGGLSDHEIRTAINERRPPDAARRAARLLIENPPQERMWVFHALLSAAVCQELGVYQDAKFILGFCEIRELPI